MKFSTEGRAPSRPQQFDFLQRPVTTHVVIASAKLRGWKGLRRCLTQKDGFIVVDGGEPPEHLLLRCQRMAPCVLIADPAFLEVMDPADFANLVDFGRSIQVLVYGAAHDERTIQNLVRMGCMGSISETAPSNILKKAVTAVARGELWVERRLITRVLQQLLFASRSPKLTRREKEILTLIARGFKNRAIAEKLSISHETVRWHIRSLHSKLGFQDRLGTALYAQQFLDDDAMPPGSESGSPRRPVAVRAGQPGV